MIERLGTLLAAIAIAASSPAQTPKREVTVAAAANLNEVFQAIGRQFEAATGIHPVFSFASTAQLAQQIVGRHLGLRLGPLGRLFGLSLLRHDFSSFNFRLVSIITMS